MALREHALFGQCREDLPKTLAQLVLGGRPLHQRHDLTLDRHDDHGGGGHPQGLHQLWAGVTVHLGEEPVAAGGRREIVQGRFDLRGLFGPTREHGHHDRHGHGALQDLRLEVGLVDMDGVRIGSTCRFLGTLLGLTFHGRLARAEVNGTVR